MNQILWIALGGAIGAVLRYLVVLGVNTLSPTDFPWATLLVNILGSFAIGALIANYSVHPSFSSFLRPFLVIGILGGFTTFSTFSLEAFVLIQKQELFKAGSYILMSFILGITAAFVGFKLFEA
ncbi:MAG: fluoride efflux transporter CrcB [Bacteroidia bacterium]|nr:fluoride efflux transporter CrcB [Bacteroidia bacterium]MCF8426725.1 fluoride efflux transporter CrcB [Bacteroidia bacterium]